MAIKDSIWNVLKGLGEGLVGDFFTVGMLKKILTKSMQAKQQFQTSQEAGTGDKATKMPNVKFGGLFDESDESAYLIGIAKLSNKDKIAVSRNLQALPKEAYRRRFRVAVGPLFEMKFVKKYHKTKKPIGMKNNQVFFEEGVVEEMANLGEVFMKSFAQLTPEEAFEICDAAGICTTLTEQASDVLEKVEKWMEDDGKENSKKITTFLDGGTEKIKNLRAERSLKKGFLARLLTQRR